MVSFSKRTDADDMPETGSDSRVETQAATRRRKVEPRHELARDMLHGLSPEEFDAEASPWRLPHR